MVTYREHVAKRSRQEKEAGRSGGGPDFMRKVAAEWRQMKQRGEAPRPVSPRSRPAPRKTHCKGVSEADCRADPDCSWVMRAGKGYCRGGAHGRARSASPRRAAAAAAPRRAASPVGRKLRKDGKPRKVRSDKGISRHLLPLLGAAQRGQWER